MTRKAVHVTTVHPMKDNRVFFKECHTLRDAGYEVVLVASGQGDELIDGIQIRYLPPATSRRRRAMVNTKLALEICQRENADIYHFHDPELMPSMSRLAQQGKPVIYDMHENIAQDMLTKPYIPRLLRPLASWTVRLGTRRWLRGMGVIFAERSYSREYPWLKHFAVVENLPRTDELLRVSAEKRTPPMLGYIGSVTRLRGSLQMLEIVRALQLDGHAVGLECVGPAHDRHLEELRLAIDRKGIRHVQLRGRLDPVQGWELMAGCRIGLALLADIPNYRESCPTKLFEYMGLGLPVIASDFPLYRGIIERHQCGICVDPTDTAAIVAAVRKLIGDPSLADQMGQRGREAVREHYSWETEAKKLLDLYASLLSG